MISGLDDYLAGLATAMELPVDRFDVAGTSITATDDRRGQRIVSHYRVCEHSVLWCDPEVSDVLAEHGSPSRALEFGEFSEVMAGLGAEVLGHGYEHLLPERWAPSDRPETVRMFDCADAATVRLVAELLDDCAEDDREGADFELDALDPYLAGWVERDRLLALCGGREWAPRPGHFDLGVIVRPAARRRGLGTAVVSAVTSSIVDDGGRPLYRCNADNEGSWRLCRSVGYRPVIELEAFQLPG